MPETLNCPCRKNCPRHGNCKDCRAHHAASQRQRPVHCERHMRIRPYMPGDERGMSELICRTLRISNAKDYPPEFIEENVRSHSPEIVAERVKDAHFYVATDRRKIIGCGGITGYWGSSTESYLLSIFVLPEYQGRGIGGRIVKTLESDSYFLRAWRTEVGSSLTAVDFYLKMGYTFKNGVSGPDNDHVVRMEKRRDQ